MSFLQEFEFDLLGPFGAGGVRVGFSDLLPTRTYLEKRDGTFIFHSAPVLAQLLAGVFWHDERVNCPTWTDAAECVCDRRGQ